ncbi:CotH kinase family protein [Clostridium grantii]|uniref:Spore coat protein H n=1 Tax=Clostridium grantii DSM 8605 TaxID=1121316 RepID=A0A1M5W0J7_9CLOT|nr:CotH kinase family protein [Clostridium grantii]SHH81025.1 spore coat protein H [Clostridium grantii DSM 8605]
MKIKLIGMLVIINLLVTSCLNSDFGENNNSNNTSIKDNQDIYKEEDVIVKELYITVLPAETGHDEYGKTFSQLNESSIDDSVDDIKVKIIFQEGSNGIISSTDFGYGLTDYNGIMELRGQSSRLAEIKSYKIKLNKNSPWNEFLTINLNKHHFDTLRIRNKLSFDLIKSIPNITSLRTEFIHLYIKDLSEEDYTKEYLDFGLYTQIEHVDTDFLKNHNLDQNGSLYKVENFEFYKYEDYLKLKEDAEYNEKEFEKILEIKGSEDHEKLIDMLDDLNNKFIHINDVFDKYFDRENYLTWLATNILFDNIDTASRNYFLYSESDSDTWYFLPWDYDKGLGGYRSSRAIWQNGLSNYWGNVLTNRFFRNKDNLEDLNKKIEEIHEIISEEKMENLIDLYKPIAIEFLRNEAEDIGDKFNLDEINLEFEELQKNIELNKANYYENLEKPMPVFMGEPTMLGNNLHFQWTESYDFQGDAFTYSVEISDAPKFETILYSKNDIHEKELIIDMLPKGTYYWRVFVTDSNENKMDAFDLYIEAESNGYYFGTKKFYVN